MSAAIGHQSARTKNAIPATATSSPAVIARARATPREFPKSQEWLVSMGGAMSNDECPYQVAKQLKLLSSERLLSCRARSIGAVVPNGPELR